MFSSSPFSSSFAPVQRTSVAPADSPSPGGSGLALWPPLGQAGLPTLSESPQGFTKDAEVLERDFLGALRIDHGYSACDWDRAAQALIDACMYLPGPTAKVDSLGRWCDALGPSLYPAFIGVLCVVGDRGSPDARRAVAGTMADAICDGRLPSGPRAAWGAASHHVGGACRLGPLEYLCAGYAEPGAQTAPDAASFGRALQALLSLLSQSHDARSLYGEQLRAVAENPLGGALSRSTGEALCRLADEWSACGDRLNLPVDAFMSACAPSDRQGGLWACALAGLHR